MSCTVNKPHDNCPDVMHEYQALEAERDSLLSLLSKERDAFGKKETELMEELNKLSCPCCGSDVNGTNWKALAGELAEACRNLDIEDGNVVIDGLEELRKALSAYDSVAKEAR